MTRFYDKPLTFLTSHKSFFQILNLFTYLSKVRLWAQKTPKLQTEIPSRSLDSNEFDITILSETWLKSQRNFTFNVCKFRFKNTFYIQE